jgi:hypothetical protein
MNILFNPLTGNPKQVTQEDIENLQKWVNIRNKIGDKYLNYIWDVADVRAMAKIWRKCREEMLSDLFNQQTEKYIWIGIWDCMNVYLASFFDAEYKFDIKPVVSLWNRGFIASVDGSIWRLHSGEKVEIVYELTKP